MQTGTGLLLELSFCLKPCEGVNFDIPVRGMFYSSDMLVDKLLHCSLNLKIATTPSPQKN